MAITDKQVTQTIDAYCAAAGAKDIDAFMRLYDPKVRVFDTWGVWSYDNAAAWRQAVEGWFTSMGSDRPKVSFEDVQTVIADSMAAVSAVVTYAAVTASGEPTKSMQNRISWTLKISGHVLRIVHEHTSAPAGFDDGKVILQRTPAAG